MIHDGQYSPLFCGRDTSRDESSRDARWAAGRRQPPAWAPRAQAYSCSRSHAGGGAQGWTGTGCLAPARVAGRPTKAAAPRGHRRGVGATAPCALCPARVGSWHWESSSRRKGSVVACWVLPCFLGCWVGRGCLVLGLGVPIGPNSKLSKGFLQMEGVPGHPQAPIGLRPWSRGWHCAAGTSA